MLKSLYIKALNNRRFLQPEPEKNTDFSLEGKWFDRPFAKSNKEFSIAAGDGSFNIKKFLMFNYCPVSAEALIYDGQLKNIEQSEIFEIDHVPFIKELVPNYMSIFELKCCLKAINEYDVDYYLFDGSILGDLQNHYPKGAKQPSETDSWSSETLWGRHQWFIKSWFVISGNKKEGICSRVRWRWGWL